jgi:hypothetical protein
LKAFTAFVVVAGMWLDFASCGGSSHCTIEASNYDQSCSVDSDCVGQAGAWPVQSGDYCHAGCPCGGDAINKSAVAHYVHDVSMTPLAAAIQMANCGFCQAVAPPCCVNNRCTTSTSCSRELTDAGNADAGEAPSTDATYGEPPGSSMCGLNVGAFDGGTDAEGPWRWCTPPESCVPFNGGWACCIVPEGGVTGGPSMCAVPGG